MEAWHDFFVASAGASGALGGLLLAAVAVNIEKIVALPGLPARVAQTLVAIGGALVVSSFSLFPALSIQMFGWIAAAVGLGITVFGLGEIPIARQAAQIEGLSPGRAILAFLLIEMVGVPMLVGGVLGIFAVPGADYVVGTAIVLSYITTLVNGWVLLIEILR